MAPVVRLATDSYYNLCNTIYSLFNGAVLCEIGGDMPSDEDEQYASHFREWRNTFDVSLAQSVC